MRLMCSEYVSCCLTLLVNTHFNTLKLQESSPLSISDQGRKCSLESGGGRGRGGGGEFGRIRFARPLESLACTPAVSLARQELAMEQVQWNCIKAKI